MSTYNTGEATDAAIAIYESHQVSAPESPIAYELKEDLYGVGASHRKQPQSSSFASSRSSQPLTLSPSIRREFARATDSMHQSVEAMQIAHEGEGVDVVELANAIEDYRSSVRVLWTYRKFGTEWWQRVVTLAAQALSENMRDEEISLSQCEGLQLLVDQFLSNRHLAKDDVRRAMTLLRDSGFDTLAFFSKQK
ncbi:hypothetical protein Rcae01_00852 [Novipirellula caenicola]|uniref:Uncharacterized protein n=2 Tax=Novipirellula caenicola TaxID=1536901 RepID=A0ABP9VJM8_9BACT